VIISFCNDFFCAYVDISHLCHWHMSILSCKSQEGTYHRISAFSTLIYSFCIWRTQRRYMLEVETLRTMLNETFSDQKSNVCSGPRSSHLTLALNWGGNLWRSRTLTSAWWVSSVCLYVFSPADDDACPISQVSSSGLQVLGARATTFGHPSEVARC
jgi:hypothetical protein